MSTTILSKSKEIALEKVFLKEAYRDFLYGRFQPISFNRSDGGFYYFLDGIRYVDSYFDISREYQNYPSKDEILRRMNSELCVKYHNELLRKKNCYLGFYGEETHYPRLLEPIVVEVAPYPITSSDHPFYTIRSISMALLGIGGILLVIIGLLGLIRNVFFL